VSSPTVRKRIYESLSGERRSELHAHLAETLKAHGADEVVVGYHAYYSGEVQREEIGEASGASRGAAASQWRAACLATTKNRTSPTVNQFAGARQRPCYKPV